MSSNHKPRPSIRGMGFSLWRSLVKPSFDSNRPCPPVSSCLWITACSECRILRQFTPMGLRLSTLVFCREQILRAPLAVSFALGPMAVGHCSQRSFAMGHSLASTRRHSVPTFHDRGHRLFPVGDLTCWPVAEDAEVGISSDYEGFSLYFWFFFAPFSVGKRTTSP
jgi:hypothetical protein